MAGEETAFLGFSTNFAEVVAQIGVGIKELNDEFERVHQLPSDVGSALRSGITRDAEAVVAQVRKIEEALTQLKSTGGGTASDSSVAVQLNGLVRNLREGIASRTGSASSMTGLDLGGYQKAADKVLTDKFLPGLQKSVAEVQQSFGKAVAGSFRIAQPETPQFNAQFKRLNEAYLRGQERAAEGRAPVGASTDGGTSPAAAAAARASDTAARVSAGAATDKAVSDQQTAKAAKDTATNTGREATAAGVRARAATTAAEATNDTAKASKDATAATVRLTRLTEKQANELAYVHQNEGNFQLAFPTKTTAEIPRSDIPQVFKNLRDQKEIHLDNLNGLAPERGSGDFKSTFGEFEQLERQRRDAISQLEAKLSAQLTDVEHTAVIEALRASAVIGDGPTLQPRQPTAELRDELGRTQADRNEQDRLARERAARPVARRVRGATEGRVGDESTGAGNNDVLVSALADVLSGTTAQESAKTRQAIQDNLTHDAEATARIAEHDAKTAAGQGAPPNKPPKAPGTPAGAPEPERPGGGFRDKNKDPLPPTQKASDLAELLAQRAANEKLVFPQGAQGPIAEGGRRIGTQFAQLAVDGATQSFKRAAGGLDNITHSNHDLTDLQRADAAQRASESRSRATRGPTETEDQSALALHARALALNRTFDERNIASTQAAVALHARALRENQQFDEKGIRDIQGAGALHARAIRENEAYDRRTLADAQRAGSTQSRAQRINTERDNQARLFPGGQPASTTFPINSTFLRDMSSGTDRYFQATLDGLKDITDNVPAVARAKRVESLNQLKAAQIQQEKDTADRIRGSAADGSYEHGSRVGPKLIQDATDQLYAETANGLRRLTQEESLQTKGRMLARAGNAPNESVASSFFSGLTSSGYGVNQSKGGGFDLNGLAKSAGVTVKYAALGSTLYAVAGAASAAGAEFLDFQDSITQADIALGDLGGHTDQTFFNDLTNSAVNAGANIGQSLDIATSAMRAFKDEGNLTAEDLKAVGVNFANVASELAVISKTDITDAAGNLKAAALGFNIPTGELSRIADVVAGAKQLGGGDEKQIGQGLANLSVAFNELGFSAEETGAIISKVQAETDESGTLIASRLTRATTILGGSAGKAAIRNLNATLPTAQQVDTTASTKQQILELGQVYAGLGAAQKAQLTAALGGTAAARELIILLENVNHLTTEADKGFTGKAAEEYKKTLGNIAAQLKSIQGEIKAITVNVTNSGILDPIVFLIEKVLHPGLTVVRQILQTFNLIPRPIRDMAAALLTVYATLRLIQAIRGGGLGAFGAGVRGGATAIGGAPGFLRRDFANSTALLAANRAAARAVPPRFDPAAAPGTAFLVPRRGEAPSPGPASAGRYSGVAANAANYNTLRALGAGKMEAYQQTYGQSLKAAGASIAQTARSARESLRTNGLRASIVQAGTVVGGGAKEGAVAGVGALRTAGSKIYGAIGPVGLALGLFTLASAANAANKRINEAGKSLDKLAKLPDDFSADTLRSSAQNYAAAASQLRNSSSGFSGTLVNFAKGDPVSRESKTADAFAAQENRAAKADDQAKKDALARGDNASIGSTLDLTTVDGLTTSLKALDDAGYNATTQFNALISALEKIRVGSSGAVTAISAPDKTRFVNAAGIAADTAVQDISKVNQEKIDKKRFSGYNSLGNKILDATGGATINRFVRRDILRNRTAEQKAVDRSGDVDKTALEEAGRNATHEFLLNPNNNIKGPEGRAALVKLYTSYFKSIVPKEDLAHIAGATADAVQKDFASQYAGITAAQLPQFYTSAVALASTAGEEAARTNALSGADVTGGKFKSDATVSAQAQLKDLQMSRQAGVDLFNSFSAADQKSQAVTFASGQEQLQEKIKQAQVDVAASTISDLQSSFELLEASKPTADQIGRINDQLAEVEKELAVPSISPADKVKALKSQAELKQQQKAQVQANAISKDRSVIDPRDDVANATQDVADIDRQLRSLKADGVTSGQAVTDLQRQRAEKVIALKQAKTAAKIAKRNVNATPDSALDTATRALADDNDRLKDLEPGTAAYFEQLAKIQQDAVALAKTVNDGVNAAQRLKIDPRNTLGLDKQSIVEDNHALKLLRDQGITSGAEVDALKLDRIQKRQQQKVDQVALDVAKANVNAFPDSAIDTANRALDQASQELTTLLPGTVDYYNKLAEIQQKKKAQAEAEAAGASLARQLQIDLTDPVAVANEALKTSRDKLARDLANKEPADVINADKIQVNKDSASADQTAFSQRLQDAQTADNLGKISHQAYLQYLNNEHDRLASRLAGIKKGTELYRQTFDQLNQTDEAIKAASEAVDQQFNIGNIRVPTPYEVRRAVQAKTAGAIAEANSAYGTGGNVTNDNSQKSLVLNGVPIEQVLAYIKDLYGAKARATAKKRLS